jgi:hypothetical protein
MRWMWMFRGFLHDIHTVLTLSCRMPSEKGKDKNSVRVRVKRRLGRVFCVR